MPKRDLLLDSFAAYKKKYGNAAGTFDSFSKGMRTNAESRRKVFDDLRSSGDIGDDWNLDDYNQIITGGNTSPVVAPTQPQAPQPHYIGKVNKEASNPQDFWNGNNPLGAGTVPQVYPKTQPIKTIQYKDATSEMPQDIDGIDRYSRERQSHYYDLADAVSRQDTDHPLRDAVMNSGNEGSMAMLSPTSIGPSVGKVYNRPIPADPKRATTYNMAMRGVMASQLLHDMVGLYRNASSANGNFLHDTWKGFWDKTIAVPNPVNNDTNNYARKAALNEIKERSAKGEELLPEEQQVLNMEQVYNTAAEKFSKSGRMTGQGLRWIAESIPEFYATGAMGKAFNIGGKAMTMMSNAVKGAPELARGISLAEQGVEKLTPGLVGKAAAAGAKNLAKKTIATGIRSAALTPLSPMFYNAIQDEKATTFTPHTGSDGNVVMQSGSQSDAKNIRNAFADTFVNRLFLDIGGIASNPNTYATALKSTLYKQVMSKGLGRFYAASHNPAVLKMSQAFKQAGVLDVPSQTARMSLMVPMQSVLKGDKSQMQELQDPNYWKSAAAIVAFSGMFHRSLQIPATLSARAKFNRMTDEKFAHSYDDFVNSRYEDENISALQGNLAKAVQNKKFFNNGDFATSEVGKRLEDIREAAKKAPDAGSQEVLSDMANRAEKMVWNGLERRGVVSGLAASFASENGAFENGTSGADNVVLTIDLTDNKLKYLLENKGNTSIVRGLTKDDTPQVIKKTDYRVLSVIPIDDWVSRNYSFGGEEAMKESLIEGAKNPMLRHYNEKINSADPNTQYADFNEVAKSIPQLGIPIDPDAPSSEAAVTEAVANQQSPNQTETAVEQPQPQPQPTELKTGQTVNSEFGPVTVKEISPADADGKVWVRYESPTGRNGWEEYNKLLSSQQIAEQPPQTDIASKTAAENPDKIIIVSDGKTLKIYGEDAEIMAQSLGITPQQENGRAMIQLPDTEESKQQVHDIFGQDNCLEVQSQNNVTGDNQYATKQQTENPVEQYTDDKGEVDFDNMLKSDPQLFAKEYTKALGEVPAKQAITNMLQSSKVRLKNLEKSSKKVTSPNQALKIARQIKEEDDKIKVLTGIINPDMTEKQPADNITEKNIPNIRNTVGKNITQRWYDAPKVTGNEETMSIADGTQLHGHWVLTEANAPTPSHDPHTLQPSEGFPTTASGQNVNDNDYRGKAAQVETMAANYDGRAIDNPIYVKDGVVISGNNRTMSGMIAAENGHDNKYITALKEKAGKFGFTTEDVGRFSHPRVFFEVTDDIPLTTDTFAKFNQRNEKSKTPTEMAIVAGKMDLKKAIGQIMLELNKYETLSDLYKDGAACAHIMNVLQNEGIINQNDRPLYFNGENITEAGKDFLESVLAGSVLTEKSVKILSFQGMKTLRPVIIKAIPELLANSKIDDNILDDLNEGIYYLYTAQRSRLTLEELVLQNNMFEHPTFNVNAVLNAIALGKGASIFKKYVSDFNSIMTSGMDLLTGENPTKQNYYDEYRQNKLTDADRTLLRRTEETNAIAGEDNKRGDLQKTGGEVSERKGTSPDELSEEQTKTLEDHEEKYKTSDGKEVTFRQETTSIQNDRKSSDSWSGSDGVQRSGDQVHVSLPGLKPGEFCYVERKFTEDKSFSFTSREKIESVDDVAYIFKNLEDEAIEHSFIVFLKRGTQPVIVHTGMGVISHVAVDTTPVNALYDRLQPDIVYMVHNHPSGDLTPSLVDKKILHALKKMMPETTVTGIIIDTKSVKYSTFYGEEINVYPRQLDNTGKEQPIKLYAFDKIAFSKDYNPAAKPIFSQKDVAAAVSSLRLGGRAKIAYLILDIKNRIVGNIHLASTNSISDSDIRTIVQNAVMMNGTGIIIYGDFDAKDIQPPDNRLENSIYTYSYGRIELLATVKIDGLHSSDHQKTVKDDDEPTLFEKDNEPYISNTPLGLSENDPEIANIVSRAKNDGTYMKAPNGKQTHLTEHQWAAVRTKAFKTWFGDWEKEARIKKILQSKPVEITGKEIQYSTDNRQFISNAFEYGKSLRDSYRNEDTGDTIRLTRSGLTELKQHDTDSKAHLSSIAAIPQIIKNSIYLTSLNNEDTKIKADSFDYYICGLKIGDTDYTVKMVTANIGGIRYYDHKLTQIEKGRLLNLIRIPNLNQEKQSTLISLKDKRLISILQNNSSKVVDDNGEPRVVYHYTDEKFNTFDLGKSRQNADIPAFFFSSEKSDWKDLGKRIIPAFLNIKNPIDKPIVNMQGQEARERLISLGYDGMITKDEDITEYAAFNPNQIKSATDNNGNYSATNNDIRFEQGRQVSKSDILAPKATEKQIDATVTALKKTGLCKEGVFIVPDQKALDKAISDYEDKISAKRQNNLNTINDKFNEELQQQIDGMLPNGHIYQLGMPSGILLSAGIPDLPIELAASRLLNKSNQINHPFDLGEVKNLVNAIQHPLSIFRSATHVGSNTILTELKQGNKNYIVAIETNRKSGKLVVNSVRSIHPRTDSQIIDWINTGLMDYAEKKNLYKWLLDKTITRSYLNSSDPADVKKQLVTAANVVKEFKNPNIPDDAPYQKINNSETMGATLPDGRIFLVKNNMRIDSAFHEFCHKLFTYAKDNKEYTHLYDAIVKVAAEAPEKIKQFVKKNYPNLGNDAFLDEVFAWQESYQSRGKIEDFLKKRGVESAKDTMFAQAWYSRLWNAIKNLWHKVKSLFAKENNKNEKPNYADLSVYDAYRQMGTNELEDKLYNTLMSERPLPSKEMLQKALPDDILDKLNKTPFGRTLSASYQKNVGNAHIQAENKNWNNQLRQYINGYRKILHNFRLPQNRFFNKTTKHGYVEIQQSILNKAVIKHNIDLHVLENLPQLLEESPIVFKSAKQDGSLVFVINAKDKNGKTIIVATSPEQNSIRSIHGRDNFEDFIRWADKGLLYDGTEEKLKTLEKTAHEYDSRDVAPQVLKDFFAKIEKFLDEKHKTERDNSEASQSNNPDVRYQSVKDENIKRDEKIKTPKQLQFDELRKMSEKQLSDWEDNQQKSIVRRLISNSEDEIYRKDSSGKERSDFAVWALKKINDFKEKWIDNKTACSNFLNVIRNRGGIVTMDDNFYIQGLMAMSSAAGRGDVFRETMYSPLLRTVKSLTEEMVRAGITTPASAYKSVNMYLMAKHALERNAAVCTGEMADKVIHNLASQIGQYHKDTNQKITEATEGNVKNALMQQIADFDSQVDSYVRQVSKRAYAKIFGGEMPAVSGDFKYLNKPLMLRATHSADTFAGEIKDSERRNNRSGMTDDTAREIIKTMEIKSLTALEDKMLSQVKQCTDYAVDTSVEFGLLSKDAGDEMKGMYKHYVPLRGWQDKESISFNDITNNYRGEVLSKINKKAKGRTSLADDPLAYIMSMAEAADMFGAKNNVYQQAYRTIQRNAGIINDIAEIEKQYSILDAAGNVINETFGRPEHGTVPEGGSVETHLNRRYRWHKTPEQMDKLQVPVIINGEQHRITFKGDFGAKIAAAIKEENMHNPLWGKAGEDIMGRATRYIARMMTNNNPRFIVTNFTRDVGYANIMYKVNGGSQLAFNKNILKSLNMISEYIISDDRGAAEFAVYREFKMLGGETGIMKNVDIDGMKNEIKRTLARMGNQFYIADHVVDGPFGKALKKSFNGEALNYIFSSIRFLNGISEATTRLACYLSEKERGVSKKEAVYRAKELTVNFNRHGTMGRNFGQLFAFFNATVQGAYNLFYMTTKNPYDRFYDLSPERKRELAQTLGINPASDKEKFESEQTAAQRAEKDKNKFFPRAITAVSSMAALCFVTSLLSSLLADEDKDESGHTPYEQLSDYTKSTNLVWYIKPLKKFITIPLPQNVRGIASAGYLMTDFLRGYKTRNQALTSFIGFNITESMPLDVGLATEANGYTAPLIVTPTVLRPVAEMAMNTNYMGEDIYKTKLLNNHEDITPQYEMVYKRTWPWLVEASKRLNRAGGGKDYLSSGVNHTGEDRKTWGGFGSWTDINPMWVQHLAEGYLGGSLTFLDNFVSTAKDLWENQKLSTTNEVPFVNIFLKENLAKPGYASWFNYRAEAERYKKSMAAAEKENKQEDLDNLLQDKYKQAIISGYEEDKIVIDNFNDLIKMNDDPEEQQRVISERDKWIARLSRHYDDIQKKYNRNKGIDHIRK